MAIKPIIKKLFSPKHQRGPDVLIPVVAGMTILVVFLGGFMLWASLSQLESAAIASGKIIVATNRKLIEHLEGGIVKKIYVKEGSVVKAGDPLIQLEPTQAKVSLDLLQGQANELFALEARLIAERDQLKTIQFPKSLLDQTNNPLLKKIITSQTEIFNTNKSSFDGQINIYNQRIEQLKNEIASLQSQVKSQQRQLELINEEIKAVAYLEKKKIVPKPRLLALQREAARLIGNRDERVAKIAQSYQKIGETQLEIIQLKDSTRNETLKSLQETQKNLAEVLENLKKAEDVHKRTLIVSPQPGTVVGLRIHTIGGVVSPGEAVMEIVPSQDELVIEARVNPLDIDVVHTGLLAKVRLLAYKQRKTPTLDGKVIQVSADALFDDITQKPYYSAKIKISQEELDKLKGVTLYPGMPVQVMIIIDKKTPLDYFMIPIIESFERAFREQ